jgi:cell division protein FtsB
MSLLGAAVVVVALVAAIYYVKHHISSARVAEVKAEINKIESESEKLAGKAKSEVLFVVDRLKALLK